MTQAERDKKLLTQTLNAAQLEAQQALRKAISDHQEEVERLVSEKVRRFGLGHVLTVQIERRLLNPRCSVSQEVVRHSLLMEHEGTLRRLHMEAEDQLRRAEREKEELLDELRSLQHDRDQSLLQAETEKQQVRTEFQPHTDRVTPVLSSSPLVNQTFSLFSGTLPEGGRENGFVRQGVQPAGRAVSRSRGGRANVEGGSSIQRAGAGEVASCLLSSAT